MSFYKRFKRINNQQPASATASRNDQMLSGHRAAHPTEHDPMMEYNQPRVHGRGVNDSTET